MQAMVMASSLIRANQAHARLDVGDLDELYAGPWQNLKDLARVVAMLGGIACYAGLLALLSRAAAAPDVIEALRSIEASAAAVGDHVAAR